MTNWECLTVEVSSPESLSKKYVVNNIYHKPYDTVENLNIFLEEFSE